MSSNSKREIITITRNRYKRAAKWKKSRILDEFCATLGFNRKYAIYVLNHSRVHRARPGRPKRYSEEAVKHLRRLWILMGQMCSRNMEAALSSWLPFYECSDLVKQELLAMSHATIDRRLKPYRAQTRRKLNTGTMVGRRFIKHIIPIKPFDFKVTEPGHVEVDTVAHCGGFMAGEFVWSINLTDRYSGWTEVRAMLGKSGFKTLKSLQDIERSLPFVIKNINSDNGSEFLNKHLIEHYGPKIMTRSRAYRKNDNCYVEQKNFTHVREIFFYDRFDRPDLPPLMNDIYSNEHSLLQNFFVPQVTLKHKLRVGSRYKRVYTEPKTPYQRLMECPKVSHHMKTVLKEQFERLNPFYLRKVREMKVRTFFKILRSNTERKTGS